MKPQIFIQCCLIVVLGLVGSNVVISSEMEMKGSDKGSMHEEMKGSESGEMKGSNSEEMMKKWKEYATPNDNHKVLNPLVGEWTHTVKWWMAPEAPPEISEGTSSIKWIMGGRFLQHTVEGTSMGQPLEGMSIVGFNNFKKHYTTLWFDNMGTGMMTGVGQFDPQTKTLADNGHYSCPMMNKERNYQAMTKIISDDEFTYEMWTNDFEGKQYRSMEITYQRVK